MSDIANEHIKKEKLAKNVDKCNSFFESKELFSNNIEYNFEPIIKANIKLENTNPNGGVRISNAGVQININKYITPSYND
jgi:hypothetical protein